MNRFHHLDWCVIGLTLALVGSGCQSQQRFRTPDEAKSALLAAVESDDKAAARAIFGKRMAELRSGDELQDEQDLASFRRQLSERCEFEQSDPDSVTLLVGREQWPFAVPLVNDGQGWRFDTDAGIEELQNRRIGRNELRTIEACRTLFDAQEIYRSFDRDGDGVYEFATRLNSSPGMKDGLYWPSPGGIDPSPIGPVFAAAANRLDEQGERLPFNGYFYRLLMRRGAGAPGGAMEFAEDGNLTRGWAVVAWPAEYDVTGIMSFLVGSDGIIYEADLGWDTESVVWSIAEYDPSTGPWQPVR